MASAGGKEVGRVSIRVVPNTDGFKRKVERDLRDLDGERIKVEADLDTDDLERKIEKSDAEVEVEAKLKDEDGLQRKLRETTSKIKEKINVATELDDRKFRTKFRDMVDSVKDVGVQVDADVDATGVAAEATGLRARLQSILGKVDTDVDLDTAGATVQGLAWSKMMAKAMTVKVRAVLDSRRLREGLRGVAQLSDMAVRPFYRMFGGEIFEGIIKGFTRFKGLIAVATLGVSALGVAIAPLVKSTWQAAAGLVEITAAVVPSVITAGALAFGALYKSFSGFGNALKATDFDEFNEAVADMGPNARRGAEGLFGLKQAFNQVTSSAQERFWGNVTADLASLTPIVDKVGASVNLLSGRFGLAANSIVEFGASTTGLTIANQLISQSTRIAGNFGEAIANAVPGVAAIGSVGAKAFADITSGISEASAAWSDSMLAKFESGELQRDMQNTIDTIKGFWDDATNVGTIVGGVFSAMTRAGEGLYGSFSEVVEKTAEWVNSAEGVAKLDEYFSSVAGTISTLAPVFAEVAGTVVSDVVPALSQMIQAAGPGLRDFGDAIASSLKQIAPHLPAIGEGLGRILSAVSPLIEKIGPLLIGLAALSGAFKVLGTVGSVAKPLVSVGKALNGLRKSAAVKTVLRGASTGIGAVGTAAGKALPRVAKFAGSKGLGMVGTAAKVAGKGLTRLIPGVGAALLVADAGRLLVKHWEPAGRLADEVADRWENGLNRTKANLDRAPDRIEQNMQRVKGKLTGTWDDIKEAISAKKAEWADDEVKGGSMGLPSVDQIRERGAQLAQAASSAWEGIRATASNAWSGVQEAWSAAWMGIGASLSSVWEGIKLNAATVWLGASELLGSVWDGVGAWWSASWANIQAYLSSTWENMKLNAASVWLGASELLSTVWDGVSAAWSGVWDGISSTLSGIWANIQATASSAFTSVSTTVSSAWDTVSSNTASAWASVTSSVASAVGSVIGSAAEMAGSVIASVVGLGSSIVSTITGAMASFVSAVSGGFSQAVSLAASLPGRVVGAMGNVGGLLVASGRALVQGFVNGIRSMIGAVADAANAVVSAARGFFPFSPAKRGPFSGRGYTTYSGKALVKDFAGGMRSEIGAVTRSAEATVKAASKPFQDLAHDKVLQPVLESNAKKINQSREKEAEAEKKHLERLAEIDADYAKRKGDIAANKSKPDKKNEQYVKALESHNEKIAKENEKHAERMAEIRKDLDESLEAPDYSDIEQSFKHIYVQGMKDMLQQKLGEAVDSHGLVEKTRQGALAAVEQARATFGDHPVYAEVEANVNAEHFEYAFNKAIAESGIAAVPVEFVISNLQQLKSDLGMGDGVVSRAIDQAVAWNWNNTDAKQYRDDPRREVHYHVEDMQEAIRRENLRVRKQMMSIK